MAPAFALILLVQSHFRDGEPVFPSPGNARADGRSGQPDFLELGRDDLLVERLHNVFVGAGMKGACDL